METAWWEWPDDRIARNRRFFEADLTPLISRLEVLALIDD